MAIPKRHNLLHCVWPWPVSAKHCSILCSTLRGKRGKTDKQVPRLFQPSWQVLQLLQPWQQALQLLQLWWQALQLNQKTNPCQCQSPLYRRRNPQISVCLVRDDCEPEQSWEPEEEAELEIITQSLSLNELRDTAERFCLSREGGIDKAIGKKTQTLSLWRRLLSGVRERYSFNEVILCYPSKWTTMETGIQ